MTIQETSKCSVMYFFAHQVTTQLSPILKAIYCHMTWNDESEEYVFLSLFPIHLCEKKQIDILKTWNYEWND